MFTLWLVLTEDNLNSPLEIILKKSYVYLLTIGALIAIYLKKSRKDHKNSLGANQIMIRAPKCDRQVKGSFFPGTEATTTSNHYHADGNGNITMPLNSTQTSVAAYHYDPFDRTITSSSTLATANTYRFSSKHILPFVANLYYYYGYRFYDPFIQRWLNRDPLEEEGGFNLYIFASEDPINRTNAFGLHPDVDIGPVPWTDPGWANAVTECELPWDCASRVAGRLAVRLTVWEKRKIPTIATCIVLRTVR